MNIQLTFKKEISNKNKNQIKGLNYEVQIKDYIINNLNKIAYLWKDIPEILLIKYGFIGSHNEERLNRKELNENPLQDTGIDILQIDSDEECILIQCKSPLFFRKKKPARKKNYLFLKINFTPIIILKINSFFSVPAFFF